MTIRVSWLFAALAFATFAQAEPKPGLAAYGALHPKFPCKRLLGGFNGARELRLSVLWHSFGRNLGCLDRWAADPRPKFLQVHLVNEVCHRNNRCGDYEVLKGISLEEYRKRLTNGNKRLLASIQKNTAPVADWLNRNPEVACSLTAGLESNLDRAAYQKLVDYLKPHFPERCRWGWNPVGNNRFGTAPIRGMIHEKHGSKPKLGAPCIANLDGEDIHLPARPAIVQPSIGHTELPRYLASFASCDAVFLWIAEFNGIGRGSFIDPRKRSNWPTSTIMQQLSPYLREGTSAPVPGSFNEADLKGCKQVLKSKDGEKRGFLWKQSDVEIYGAVAILPRKKKYKRVVVRKNGKVLENLAYAAQYTEDGSNRQIWRSDKKAHEFPGYVVLKAEGDCWKLADPTVRND